MNLKIHFVSQQKCLLQYTLEKSYLDKLIDSRYPKREKKPLDVRKTCTKVCNERFIFWTLKQIHENHESMKLNYNYNYRCISLHCFHARPLLSFWLTANKICANIEQNRQCQWKFGHTGGNQKKERERNHLFNENKRVIWQAAGKYGTLNTYAYTWHTIFLPWQRAPFRLRFFSVWSYFFLANNILLKGIRSLSHRHKCNLFFAWRRKILFWMTNPFQE